MRIAFISYEFPPDTGKGGIGTYTSQVASMLAKHNWDVHVFAGSFSRQCERKENGVVIHWIKIEGPEDFRLKVLPVFSIEHVATAFDLIESAEIHGNAWEIKKTFPDIPLVVRLHAPNCLVEQLKKKYIPFSAKLRFFLGALKRGRWDAGYWRTYNYRSDTDYQFCILADRITAPSYTMKQWAVANWQLSADSITVIPNIFTAPAAMTEMAIHHNAVNKEILFFGRLNVLKGIVNATMAIKKILSEFPAYRFKVIGDDWAGPVHKQTMRQWMQQQLSTVGERVFYLNGLPYDQLPGAIADAEIVLLPSLFESFSYTCAEAMAAGKAVVASRATGMADMIEHNKNGLLIDPENVSEIYAALKQMILDNERRYRMAVQARESILTKFNSDMLIEKYRNFYNLEVNPA